jgi:hypothetical protein
MLRLAELSKKMNANDDGEKDSKQSDGLDAKLAGFFPSLKRRLKRLDRMGAHVELESSRANPAAVIFLGLLVLLLGPLALLALGLLLLLIGILTLASLAFMTVWMAFVHQIFVVFLHH